MKKTQKKLHLSNDGFSLMELIVTMLVSAVVTAAVAGFLTIGTRYYQAVDNETRLQTESQVAELFLTELLQESTHFKVLESSAYPDIHYAFEVERKLNPTDPNEVTTSVVALKGSQLWYADVTGAETDWLNQLLAKGTSQAFLANHVTNIQLDPPDRSAAVSSFNNLVRLHVEFELHGKTYTGESTIALRNKKIN